MLFHVTQRFEVLLLALVADLPGLLLAVLCVAVLLSLLGASLHLELADLLGLKMAVLLLHGEGEGVGEFLTIPVNISLTHLDLDLPRDVVTILFWFPGADHTLGPITVILGALVPLAVELHGVGAGHVIYHLLFHVAIRRLQVGALVIVLGGHIDLVSGVANTVFACEASLHLVRFFQGLIMNCLYQVTNQLIHIKANTLHTSLNDTSAVLVRLCRTLFLILRPTGGLRVRLALILKHH